MNDSQRIDALKLIIINLIDILNASCTEETDDHYHNLFDGVDTRALEELRTEVNKL